MAAPTNTTAGTAIDVGSLPASAVQDVHDAGTTHDVWYKYSAVAGDNLISVFGFGDLTTYQPRTRIYEDAGITVIIDTGTSSATRNRPTQVIMSPGTTYWFRFTPNAGNPSPAILSLEVRLGPDDLGTGTVLAVNDDTENFPLMLISGDDGDDNNVLKAIDPFPAGEAGDILRDPSVMLFSDAWNGHLELFDENFALITTVALDVSFGFAIRASNALDVFYVGLPGSPPTATTVDRTGAIGATTWTLTGTSDPTNVIASNDGSVLYWATGDVAGPIRRHDSALDTALPDLWPGVASERIADILVLADDTILATAYLFGSSFRVLHLSPVGSLLNVFGPITTNFPGSTFPRLAYAPDDPNSFWTWFHPVTGISEFRNIKISDGSNIAVVNHAEYELGTHRGAMSASPPSLFGISFSCPFLTFSDGNGGNGGNGGGTPGPPPAAGVGVTLPLRRQRAAPHINEEQHWKYYSRLQLDLETGVGLPGVLAGLGLGDDPQIMLDWSDDGGHSWWPERWQSAGKAGDTKNRRALWRRLGRSRDRVFRITVSDPVKWAFVDAYLAGRGGTS